MIIEMNDLAYKTEVLAYLQIFYPLEEIQIDDNKQPTYRIDVKASTIKVAYFDGLGSPIERTLSEGESGEFIALEGREKRILGKLYLKKILYDLCGEITGIIPPWGALMGIRPTKLAFKKYEKYGDWTRVSKDLVATYKLSSEKADLVTKVAKIEAPFLAYEHSKHSVYIGIPFCPSRCSYCSFTSFPKESFPQAFLAYTDLLISELKAFPEAFRDVRSIYIGGGTPTSLEEGDFDRLLKAVRQLLGDVTIEFTVEAGRADSITIGKLESMQRYGVNRIAINPQTSHDKTLTKIGRTHNFEDVRRIYAKARMLGFDHINMDLILGLPEETVNDVIETIRTITAMAPESITIHTMALKRASKLTAHKKEYLLDMSHKINAMLLETSATLLASGYHAYYLYRQKNMIGNFENVGYCLPGKESIYNIHTMEEVESIIAFGAGAISKRVKGGRIKRLDQPKDVNMYRSKLEEIIQKKKSFFEDGL